MTPLDNAGFLRTPTARHFPTLRKSFHLDVHDVQEQVCWLVCVLVSWLVFWLVGWFFGSLVWVGWLIG